MSTCLQYFKELYYEPEKIFIDCSLQFDEECLERMGKQFLSITVSLSLMKSKQKQYTNKNIGMALKKLEDDLVLKLGLSNKRQIYRLFGNYLAKEMKNLPEQPFLQFELAMMFFFELDKIIYQSQASKVFPNQKLIYTYQSQLQSMQIQSQTQKIQTDKILTNKLQTDKIQANKLQTYKIQTNKLLKLRDQNFISSIPHFIKDIESKNFNYPQLPAKQLNSSDTDNSDQSFELQQQNTEDLFQFNFQLTKKDLEKASLDYSEIYFLNLVSYLKNISSPQTELTYIWQHLKWKNFESSYLPFMNDNNEWVCTARIVFSKNLYPEESLEKTKSCKNKKKAKQLACMDLLKALYLRYPEVWTIYKHLKQEKKLIITPLEEQKDEEELALIMSREGYIIDKEKIEKLYKRGKTDIKKMMESISAKAELNNLLQQLPGRVISPKLEKKIVDGAWSVPVRIEYRTDEQIDNFKPPKIYEKTVICQNGKIAEEEAYMEAIIALYEQNPNLFEKIQSIKLAKGIKDVEKKLPTIKTWNKLNKSNHQRKIILI